MVDAADHLARQHLGLRGRLRRHVERVEIGLRRGVGGEAPRVALVELHVGLLRPVALLVDDLLGTLLARALQILPPEQAEALAEEVGFDYGRSLASRMAPAESQRSVKAALAMMGKIRNELRLPLTPISDAPAARLREVLASMGLLGAKA